MCPDQQLLSAYYDEELDPVWRRRIEEHLSGCASCSEKLGVYAGISGDLASAPVPDLAESQARSWQVIQAHMRHPVISLWRRRLSIPLPIVAAAAAAFVAVIGLGIFVHQPASESVEQSVADTSSFGLQTAPMNVRVSNLNDIIDYLNSQDLGDNVIIQLPKNISQMSTGQPQLLRASDSK